MATRARYNAFVVTPPGKPRLAVLLFIPVFLFYGLLACALGYYGWRDWTAISPTLRMFSMLTAVTGPVMWLSSLRILGSLGRSTRALRTAGLAAASFGLLQAIGSLAEIVPCSGPD